MFLYLLYIFLALFIYRIYQKDSIRKVYNIYSSYKKMVDPDSSKGHIYTIKSLFSILLLIVPLFKTSVFSNTTNTNENEHKKNNNKKFEKKYIKIPYKYREKEYFYLLKVPKGVQPLLSIVDENDTNIEEELTPYLGPNLDCHNTNITPNDFGYQKVIITTIFDKKIIFEADQIISL